MGKIVKVGGRTYEVTKTEHGIEVKPASETGYSSMYEYVRATTTPSGEYKEPSKRGKREPKKGKQEKKKEKKETEGIYELHTPEVRGVKRVREIPAPRPLERYKLLESFRKTFVPLSPSLSTVERIGAKITSSFFGKEKALKYTEWWEKSASLAEKTAEIAAETYPLGYGTGRALGALASRSTRLAKVTTRALEVYGGYDILKEVKEKGKKAIPEILVGTVGFGAGFKSGGKKVAGAFVIEELKAKAPKERVKLWEDVMKEIRKIEREKEFFPIEEPKFENVQRLPKEVAPEIAKRLRSKATYTVLGGSTSQTAYGIKTEPRDIDLYTTLPSFETSIIGARIKERIPTEKIRIKGKKESGKIFIEGKKALETHDIEWLEQFPWQKEPKETPSGIRVIPLEEQAKRKATGAFLVGREKDFPDLLRILEKMGDKETKRAREAIKELTRRPKREGEKLRKETEKIYYGKGKKGLGYLEYGAIRDIIGYGTYTPRAPKKPASPYPKEKTYIPAPPSFFAPPSPYVPPERPYTPYEPHVPPPSPYTPHTPPPSPPPTPTGGNGRKGERVPKRPHFEFKFRFDVGAKAMREKKILAYKVEIYDKKWKTVTIVGSKRTALVHGAQLCLDGVGTRFRVKQVKVTPNEVHSVFAFGDWAWLRKHFKKTGNTYILRKGRNIGSFIDLFGGKGGWALL